MHTSSRNFLFFIHSHPPLALYKSDIAVVVGGTGTGSSEMKFPQVLFIASSPPAESSSSSSSSMAWQAGSREVSRSLRQLTGGGVGGHTM